MTTDRARLAAIADAVWQRRLEKDVYSRLRNGVDIQQLPRETLQAAESDETFAALQTRRLRKVDVGALPANDRLTAEFLQHRLEWDCQSSKLWWSSFPVTPYTAMILGLYLQLVFAPFRFESSGDADRYLSLLRNYGVLVSDLRAKLAQQAERGWRIPRPALSTVRATLQALLQQSTEALVVDSRRLAPLGDAASKVEREVRTIVQEDIRKTLSGLLADLDSDYAEKAPAGVGLSQYPGGREAYDRLIRYHTTLNLGAQRIHELGVEQVEMLTGAMAEIRSRLGFDGGEDLFHRHLVDSGRLHAATVADVERRYRDCIARMEPQISSYFSVTPKALYSIQRLDPSSEPGISYGYYQPPTDANPTGLYRFNGSGLETRSQLSAPALIYHELVPGHHFHLARQKENDTLPLIRREAIELTAFNEGWAEYASWLAGEMGLYDDPYDHYGRLVHERFTAQRLVVDTGMNALGWSLDKAREYMRRYTLESEAQVQSETLRYSTDMPAQGLAYRIGFLKLRELRSKAQSLRGSRFDIREFHEWILGAGALPLTVLENHVQRQAAT